MKLKASIDHQGTIGLVSEEAPLAVFLLDKAAEWAAGRRSGKFNVSHDAGASVDVWFGDITRFAVEVSQ